MQREKKMKTDYSRTVRWLQKVQQTCNRNTEEKNERNIWRNNNWERPKINDRHLPIILFPSVQSLSRVPECG